jgi:hypothetical protein
VSALSARLLDRLVAFEELREAGEALAGVLNSTLYSPPGFTGPPVWWDNQARTALALWRAALARLDSEGDA